MVFRERRVQVAGIEALAKMIGRVAGVDANKYFASIISEYATEVFQETYDVNILKRKVGRLRAVQTAIKQKKSKEESLINRLERMGQFYDEQEKAREKEKKPPK